MMIERFVMMICIVALGSSILLGCGTSSRDSSRTFTVGGAVHHPGVFRLPVAGLTMQEALAIAGGPVTGDSLSGEVDAYLRKVQIIRTYNGQTRALVIDASTDPGRDVFVVAPGDRIFVPKKL